MALTGPDSPHPQAEPPDEGDVALIEAVAGRIVRMGLTAPAVFFLESSKPLSYVGSQALVFLEPFVKSFLTLRSYDRFVAMLEDRRNIEKLIVRIEDLDETARKEEKEQRRKEKEEKRRRGEQGRDPSSMVLVNGVPRRRPSWKERLAGWLKGGR